MGGITALLTRCEQGRARHRVVMDPGGCEMGLNEIAHLARLTLGYRRMAVDWGHRPAIPITVRARGRVAACALNHVEHHLREI